MFEVTKTKNVIFDTALKICALYCLQCTKFGNILPGTSVFADFYFSLSAIAERVLRS
jgi:hypothetical protein